MNTKSSPLHAMVCGDFAPEGQPLARQCAEALGELGLRVTRVDSEILRRWFPEALKRWSKSIAKLGGQKQRLANYYAARERARREQRVCRALTEAVPDVVLVIRGNDVGTDVLRRLRTAGAVTICWWIKDVSRAATMYTEREHYDLYYCIHRSCCRNGIEYLPAYALDPARYRASAERNYVHDVGFVGIWSRKRQAYLEALADVNLAIVGPGWRTRSLLENRNLIRHVVAGSMYGERLTRFYQSARIIVNINQWDATDASGTTLRVADVPACGSLLVTEYSEGIEEIYRPGREVVTFTTREELEEKTRYYLEHAVEREAIARAGYERAMRIPRHVDRVRRIVDDVAALRDRQDRPR